MKFFQKKRLCSIFIFKKPTKCKNCVRLFPINAKGDEAIVNAICHRDYRSNGSVQVMLFRNRLEIWNPGVLPFGLTIQKLYEDYKSIPANPLLAEPMYYKGYIEKAGTGTEDIVEKCLAYGLPKPIYRQDEDFVS